MTTATLRRHDLGTAHATRGSRLRLRGTGRPAPRIGQISFINALPIIVPLVSGRIELDAEIFHDEPGHLNRALDREMLDISAVSSFHYLNRKGDSLIPNISISSHSEVGSVFLYSKADIRQLNGKPIAVPITSQTSVALLKILLLESCSVAPEIVAVPFPDPYDEAFAAACLFGDQALMFDFKYRTARSSDLLRLDLGLWWRRLTGLPMVFAVWAARDAWISNNHGTFIEVSRALAESAVLGQGEMLSEVVAQASARIALPRTDLVRYYKNQLCFDLKDDNLKSLEIFKRLCVAHKLLDN